MQPITWIVRATLEVAWYRPAYSSDGKTLLFERTENKETVLYTCPADDGSNPTAFLKTVPPALKQQTRPDWSWTDKHPVAFAGTNGIWVADEKGNQARHLIGTAGMTYPSWYPDQQYLAVMVGNDSQPYTGRYNRDGATVERLMPDNLYAGMPSISQANSAHLAFPGQPADGTYDQNNNQIYISNGPSNATLLDGKQGRAPWWSPDGSLVAFESDRSGKGYAIYVARPDGSHLRQLTDPSIGAQHPKFSPNGKQIVFAGHVKPGENYSIGVIPFNP